MNNDIRILLEFARRSLIPFGVLLSFSGLGVALMNHALGLVGVGYYVSMLVVFCVFWSVDQLRDIEHLPIARKRLNTLRWCYRLSWWILPMMASVAIWSDSVPNDGANLSRTFSDDVLPMMLYFICFMGCLTLPTLTEGQCDHSPRIRRLPKLMWRIRITFLAAYLYVLVFESSTPLKLAFSGIALALIVVWFLFRDYLIPRPPAPPYPRYQAGTVARNSARLRSKLWALPDSAWIRSLWVPLSLTDHLMASVLLASTPLFSVLVEKSFAYPPPAILLPMLLLFIHTRRYRKSLLIYRSLPVNLFKLYFAGILPPLFILSGYCLDTMRDGYDMRSMRPIIGFCGVYLLLRGLSFLAKDETDVSRSRTFTFAAFFFVSVLLHGTKVPLDGIYSPLSDAAFLNFLLALCVGAGMVGLFIQYLALKYSSRPYKLGMNTQTRGRNPNRGMA